MKMNFDPGGHRASSPIKSGRDSPLSRSPRPNVEDGVNRKDKAYRRYASGVERALSSFDTAQQDWADYISFLGRLLKALQANPPGSHGIPDRQAVATRLAQCLNPTLPSGVHQKALEVYAFVFTVIGHSILARDLQLYFPGLSPVLSFASLSVRPYFLALLENHILLLDAAALRPALKAIILSLLPALEDETSEDFEDIVRVLDSFREASGRLQSERLQELEDAKDSYFWQCFFLATITSPSRRQGALAFLVRQLPKFGTAPRKTGNKERDGGNMLASLSPAAQAALSPEPGLLIRCFAAGLSDKQLLVQRGFLDMLLTHLPLDSAVLQHAVPRPDLDHLIFAAAGVVSRRDMSLNRRLWAWFLGPEPKSEFESASDLQREVKSPALDPSSYHAVYFAKFGLRSLIRSILALFEKNLHSPSERARPFRICLSLMDRWEVGGLLIPELFIPAMANAYEYSQFASKFEVDEVMKSASIFFDGVESGLIWAKFFELATQALDLDSNVDIDRIRNLELCAFMIHRFNLKEEEMILYHMPLSILSIVTLLNAQSSSLAGSEQTQRARILALDVTEKLVVMTPDRAFPPMTEEARASYRASKEMKDLDVLRTISRFYNEDQRGMVETSWPLPTPAVGTILFEATVVLFTQSVSQAPVLPGLDSITKILCFLLQKIPGAHFVLRDLNLLSSLHSALDCGANASEDPIDFSIVNAVSTALVVVQQVTADAPYFGARELLNLQDSLVALLWAYLSPTRIKYHVEAVRCLWLLESVSSSKHCVEASLTRLLSPCVDESMKKACVPSEEGGRRFAILWTHSMQEKSTYGEKGLRAVSGRNNSIAGISAASSIPTDPASVLARPLLLLLDSLAEEGTESSAFVISWLQHLPALPKVFDILISKMRLLRCFQDPIKMPTASSRRLGVVQTDTGDSNQCLYYLKHVSRILKNASEHTWLTVAGEMIEPHYQQGDEEAERVPLQTLLVQVCLKVLDIGSTFPLETTTYVNDLHRVSLEIIMRLVQGPFSAPLKDLRIELRLIDRLQKDLDHMDPLLQMSLLGTITAALKLQVGNASAPPKSPHQRNLSRDLNPSASTTSLSTIKARNDVESSNILAPPSLVECLKAGFSSPSSYIILDSWVNFLVEVLPLFADAIFQNLMPLVECFCEQISFVFDQLRSTFRQRSCQKAIPPEPTLISLMNGLEQILARGHDRLVNDELRAASSKSPDQPQSFFGNMVQGVFASADQQPTRTATANNRLAVLLCFQDTVRTCFSIWSWGLYGPASDKQDVTSFASFGYTSLRMRNRARRLLEHLFAAEALECLETLAVLFCHPPHAHFQPQSVMGLLNALNGSRPKHTISAIFNAIYSRTNPTALDPGRTSSLTSELSDVDVAGFLVEYLRSIEDDAMDEVWVDCMVFLKDVLSNPLLHSQILPMLLDFVALIAEKVDNTNFGEQRKMRKELGDIFLRLLTAALTTRPAGFLQEPKQQSSGPQPRAALNGHESVTIQSRDFLSILATVVPRLQLILTDNERINTAASSISVSVTGPTIRAKSFPTNIDSPFLDLLLGLAKLPQNSKSWRKDVNDALNDTRFFASPVELARSHWAPILHQLILIEKERMPELLGRLTTPTTAGIVFGVGATSARMEADKKAQLNLRRIALLIVSSGEDTFVPTLGLMEEKLVELLIATPTSSPSSAIRSEVYLVLRALILKISSVHLAPLWPIINEELRCAITSMLPDSLNHENYTSTSILQACKLLDTLVALEPDDFQLHEWLFITDTIDAVYRPTTLQATALADEIAEALGTATTATTPSVSRSDHVIPSLATNENMRRPILDDLLKRLEIEEGADVRLMAKGELAARVLRPFLGQLSMVAFEATYGMLKPDVGACIDGLLVDLFDDADGGG